MEKRDTNFSERGGRQEGQGTYVWPSIEEKDRVRLTGEGAGTQYCISVTYRVCINIAYIDCISVAYIVDTRGPSGPKNNTFIIQFAILY